MLETVYPKNSGVRKAAILILALGDELAREVFKRLGEDESRKRGRAATQLAGWRGGGLRLGWRLSAEAWTDGG